MIKKKDATDKPRSLLRETNFRGVMDNLNGIGSSSVQMLTKVTDLTKNLRKRRVVRSLRDKKETKPFFSSEPLTSYKYDPKLGRDEKVVVTVKTTLQVHKNDRQEEQMRRPTPEVF